MNEKEEDDDDEEEEENIFMWPFKMFYLIFISNFLNTKINKRVNEQFIFYKVRKIYKKISWM